MALNIASLNVNGIRDNVKRTTIFHWLKSQKYDVCMLQETHCNTQQDVTLWSKEWNGKAFWSLGTNMSKGVVFLIKPGLDLDIVKEEKDNEGRYIHIDVKIDDVTFSFINVYAPNNPVDRKKFFNDVNTKILHISQVNQERNIILGGDFNCTQNPCMDRRVDSGLNAKKPDAGHVELINIVNSNELEDVWRRRNPNLKKYTYFKKNSKSASRIDLWFTSKLLESNITKPGIVMAPNTDHAAITLNVNTSKCERGTGFWKMNTSVLKSKQFDETFMSFWKSWEKSIDKYDSKKEWWEITKVKIKELSIAVAKQLSKEHNIKVSKLQKELLNEKHKNDINHQEVQRLTDELNSLYQTKAEGARIRARLQQFEDGEKSSKFFFEQEKIHSKSKMWQQIKDSNGQIKIGITHILEEQVNFYSKLMTSEGWDEEAANTLLNNIDVVVSDEEKEMCEQNISEEELSKGVKKLKTGKSPGFDGIPSEFYIKYWDQIKDTFIQVVKEIEETEQLCISQYRGVICLLFKQGDRDEIGNWRPITLLNTDYKLIAIVYASRLKKVLPILINDDQKAYIEGRQITESVRLTQDVIEYVDENNLPGAIISLDQKKAYDRVEWGYLKACFKKIGFGPKFCNWIMMLYKNGQSCILTNGFISRFFKLSRSMRQGCPIAAFLYIIQAEPMAQTIRKNEKIKGIEIPTPEVNTKACVKISMFADDTQLYHSTEASIIEGFKTIDIYCKASGAMLNLHKTKGLYIGQWKDKLPKFKKIKWVTRVTGLGVEFGYNINYEDIWMKKFF